MNTPSDDKLDAALGKLPPDIQPARDLWPGIAARIAVRRTRVRNGWSYGVAVAAVVVAAAAITWSLFRPNATAPGTQMVANATANHGVASKAVDMLAQFTAQLVSDNNLPPKARTALLDNLRMVHADILQTEVALKKYPNDVNLRTLLFNLYQQQAQLLNQAQQAQIQTTARTDI